jgi:hypothetical protein
VTYGKKVPYGGGVRRREKVNQVVDKANSRRRISPLSDDESSDDLGPRTSTVARMPPRRGNKHGGGASGEGDNSADDSGSEEVEVANPAAKKGSSSTRGKTKATSDDESDSSGSKNLAELRTARLDKRHDPRRLKKREDSMKRRKLELQRQKIRTQKRAKQCQQIDKDDSEALPNQRRLFNEFYNQSLRGDLRNHRRTESERDTEKRVNTAANKVNKFLEDNYPAPVIGPSAKGSAPSLEPAEVIQKLIYEPPTLPNGSDGTFTVVYQDERRLHGVTVEYLNWALGPGIVYCALKTGSRIHECNGKQVAFTVPAGDSNEDVAPIACLVKRNSKGQPLKMIKYPQGDSSYCFMYSFASALHYMGKPRESRIIASMSKEVSSMSLVDQLNYLVDLVKKKVCNITPMARNHNLKDSTITQLLEAAKNEQLMIVVPKPKGKSTSHAVTICVGLVFDSTQEYPLTLTSETFDFVAGSTGFEKVYMTRSFIVH